MSFKGHYPGYNVMNEQQEWDSHTQHIVQERLVRQHSYRFLTPNEAEILRAWCSCLLDDHRAELIGFVLDHIDQTLASNKGEGQRKPNVPPADQLIRTGLEDVARLSESLHQQPFYHLDSEVQKQLMTELSTAGDENMRISPKDFFKKILTLTLEAYYSHPMVWSEIGYGGPAYPRGYVRLDIGKLDPWEAKKES